MAAEAAGGQGSHCASALHGAGRRSSGAAGGHCALRWRLLLHCDASRLFITETNWGLVRPRRGCTAVCGITACTQLQAGYYWTRALVFAAHHSGQMTFTVHRQTNWRVRGWYSKRVTRCAGARMIFGDILACERKAVAEKSC